MSRCSCGDCIHKSVCSFKTNGKEKYAQQYGCQYYRPISKFRDADALYKAYQSLEKEFTKRSQRLKELEAATQPQQSNVNTCVCCGAIIPEGLQVCHNCAEGTVKAIKKDIENESVDTVKKVLIEIMKNARQFNNMYHADSEYSRGIGAGCYNTILACHALGIKYGLGVDFEDEGS